jgi:hypothetical protein
VMEKVEIGDVAVAYDNLYLLETYLLVMRNVLLIPLMDQQRGSCIQRSILTGDVFARDEECIVDLIDGSQFTSTVFGPGGFTLPG